MRPENWGPGVCLRATAGVTRPGEFEAARRQGRVTLPKTFRKRGSDETATRDTRELVIELTPACEAWFQQVNEKLAAAPIRGAGNTKVKPTVENIESGAVDFQTLAEDTRRKIQAAYVRGQQLGQSRAQKTRGACVKTTRGRSGPPSDRTRLPPHPASGGRAG